MSKQSAAHERAEKAALHAAEEKAEAAAQEAAAPEVAASPALDMHSDKARANFQENNSDKLKEARDVLLRHLGNAELVAALENFIRAVK